MAEYVTHTQGKRVLYLVPITEIDEGTIYLDFTSVAKPANTKDKRAGHDSEKGPNFGHEVHRALEYAEYLQDCKLTKYNVHKYNTRRGYSLFTEND